MGVTKASTKAVYRLRKKIQKLGAELVPEIADALGVAAIETVRQSFAKAVDPDGTPWPAPKDGGRALDRTGRLKNSFRLIPSKNGFRIVSDAIDARAAPKFFRKSSTVIPRGSRKYGQIVQGKRAILWRRRHSGKRWRKAFLAAIRRIVKKHAAVLKNP